MSFDTNIAFQRTAALKAAIALDLFTHVADGRHTAARVADDCWASPRGVRIPDD